MINQPDTRTTDHSQPRETVNHGVTDDTARSTTINQPDTRTTDHSQPRETVNHGVTDDTARSTTINQPDTRMPDHSQPRETVNHGVTDDTARSATTDGYYAESRHANYVDPVGNQIESQVEVYQDKNQGRANIRSWVVTIISYCIGVLEVILTLRFLFRLLGASQDNSFILFLYQFSGVFLAPFNGILNDLILGTDNVLELSTLVAMLIFALIAWGLAALSSVVFRSNYNGRQQATTTWREQR